MKKIKEGIGYKLSKNYFRKKGQRKREITRIGISLNVAVILTLVAGLDILHSQSIQLFFFLFPLAIISFFMGRKITGEFTVKRYFQGTPSADESFFYDLILKRTGGKESYDITIKEWQETAIPSVEMVELIPEPGEEKRNRWDRFVRYYRWQWLMKQLHRGESKGQTLKQIQRDETVKLRMKLKPVRRGVFPLKGIQIAQPDPFNFYRVIRHIPEEEVLLVWPRRYPVSLNHLFSGSGSLGHYDYYDQIGEGDLFWGIRDYRPGDPLKKIHWKSWAKTGKPIVKEFQQESNLSCSVVIDTIASIEEYFHIEHLITLGASIAETVLERGIPLREFWLNSTAMTLEGDHPGEIFNQLARYQFNPEESFKELQKQFGSADERMGMIFWITTVWSGDREDILRQLIGRGLSVRVFVLRGEPPRGGSVIDRKVLYGIREGA